MRLKNLTMWAVGLSTAGLLMAACSSTSNNGASSNGSTQSVKSGGSVTYALDESIPGWNLLTSADNEYVLQEVLDTVWPTVFNADQTGTPFLNTQLATSATQTSTNPQTIVYKLDPKAKWSDGQPIDAFDFWYNWEAQSGSSTVNDIDGKPFDDASSAGYNQIKSVTGSNPASGSCKSDSVTGIPGSIACGNGGTVTVTFSTPFADWKGLFSPMLPAHEAAKVGWNAGFQDFHNVLSGSWYEISNYVENQYVVLKKNPGYWGTPANLDTITFQIFNGDQQAVPAMQNGEVQIINPLELDLATVQQADQLTGVTKKLIGGYQYQHIDFNQSDPYLAMAPVRQAIAYGTDRKQIVARTIGEYDPAIVPAGNRILVPGQAGYVNNGAAFDNVDVAKAKSLLQSAGMTMGADGYFQPSSGPLKGQDLSFTLKSTSGNTLRANIEQLFQADMKAIGIKINTQNEPSATLFPELSKGQFQMTLFAWVLTPFPTGVESSFCGYQDSANCGNNWNTYSNPQVTKLLKDGAAASSSQTELSDYNQADKLMWQDMVTLPLFQAPVLTVWSSKYGNIVPNPTNFGIPWNANLWGLKAS